MFDHTLKLMVCLVVCFTLIACGRSSLPEENEVAIETSFETPISNQVEGHDETAHSSDEHEGHEGAEHQAAAAGAQAQDAENQDGDIQEHTHLDPALASAEMGVALVPSELVVGDNRFAVGLFDAEGQAVQDAIVHFDYYNLTDPDMPVLESHADATRQQTPDGLTTIFTQDRDFERAGAWGVEVQATFANGTSAIKRIGFQVLAESASPIPGEVAPSVDTGVSRDVNNDLSKLTSALTPNPAFYEMSLADALTSGKPTVLLFATPAFCQTRFCGPAYEITSELQQKYGDRVNFIHVEIYAGLPDPAATNWEVAPAMTAFGLSTEPWLFLLDRNGMVVYRVEGLFTVDEVERYLPAMMGS